MSTDALHPSVPLPEVQATPSLYREQRALEKKLISEQKQYEKERCIQNIRGLMHATKEAWMQIW